MLYFIIEKIINFFNNIKDELENIREIITKEIIFMIV